MQYLLYTAIPTNRIPILCVYVSVCRSALTLYLYAFPHIKTDQAENVHMDSLLSEEGQGGGLDSLSILITTVKIN